MQRPVEGGAIAGRSAGVSLFGCRVLAPETLLLLCQLRVRHRVDGGARVGDLLLVAHGTGQFGAAGRARLQLVRELLEQRSLAEHFDLDDPLPGGVDGKGEGATR